MSWIRATLKEETDVITKGTTPTTLGYSYTSSGIPFLRAQNLINGTVSVEADPLFISKDTHEALSRSKIRSHDILIAIAGTIGRASIVPDNRGEMNCNQAVAIVRPTNKIDRRFFLHWLNSDDAKSQITKGKVTGVISNLSLSQIGALKLPIPPIKEQMRIAAILDHANALRQSRLRAITRLNDLSQSIFCEMFGNPVHNEKKWSVEKLKNLSTKISSGSTPVGGSKVYVEKGIIFLRSQNVWRNKLELDDVVYIDEATHQKMKKSSLKHGDILITKTGRINTENSSLGRAAMFLGENDSANVNGHV